MPTFQGIVYKKWYHSIRFTVPGTARKQPIRRCSGRSTRVHAAVLSDLGFRHHFPRQWGMRRKRAALNMVSSQNEGSLGFLSWCLLFQKRVMNACMVSTEWEWNRHQVSVPTSHPRDPCQPQMLCEPHTSLWDFEMEMMDDFLLHPGNLSPSNSSNSF